jgi:hypothetical protein
VFIKDISELNALLKKIDLCPISKGGILGAIIGDIAGSRFEFRNEKSTDVELFTDADDFTDDTVIDDFGSSSSGGNSSGNSSSGSSGSGSANGSSGTMTPGSNSGSSAAGSTGLPTYEDMLRNGRDLDDDGFLNDHR